MTLYDVQFPLLPARAASGVDMVGAWAVNGVYCTDALTLLAGLPDNSVDLVVTSPPYDNLRTYKGYTFDFQPIARETYRVMKPGGVVVWVVGDETVNFCETLTSFKQALFFRYEVGFNLLDTMIYFKENYAPMYPGTYRYANQFEYMFVFSKGKPSTFNPFKIPKVENRNGMSMFRKKDGTRERKKVTTTGLLKDASNVWSFPVGFENTGHPAVFPEELAERHILTWSNAGDVVLDYFLGSGTTAKEARNLGRRYLGCDISEDYCAIARRRLAMPYTPLMFTDKELAGYDQQVELAVSS